MLALIIIAYTLVIGVFLASVAVAVVEGQRRNRSDMKKMRRELDRLIDQLRQGNGERR
jgi:uncharacterized membrane-anchored protein YhcB (DUF1043 family)